MSDQSGQGPTVGDDGDDLWSASEPAGPRRGGRGPAQPPRRGPARPPRRPGPRPPAARRAAPERPAPTRGARPGRPGAVPTEPTTGPVPVVTAPRADDAWVGGERADDRRDEPFDDGRASDRSGEEYEYDYEYEYEELPEEGRFPRWLGVLVVFALLVGGVVFGALWWYDRQIDPPGSPGETVSVEIPRGASTSGIGAILDREGVVPNALVFNFYVSRKDAGPFQAGVYRLRRNSDIDLVLRTMAEGPAEEVTPDVVRVSIPEGLTVEELVARVAEQVPRLPAEDLRAALAEERVPTDLRPDGQPSYEGLLFPATYEVGGTTDAVDLLGDLAAEMASRVGGLDAEAAKDRVRQQFGVELSTYQLVTVASLVQAEAGNADEAPRIATVIYNRLAEDSAAFPLGIDAVDEYGAERAGVEVAAYRQTAEPYNTRRVAGLPPTPIGAPGDVALQAAFNPAVGPWMYYVLTDPGVHTFAVTDAEFQAAKQICVQKDLGCG